MEHRTLGHSNLELSVLGFGCGGQGGLFVRGSRSEQLAAAEQAIASGVNYFDTAAGYGNGKSEENIGAVLQALRAEVTVGTKISLSADELPNASAVLEERLQSGLKRLDREYVDVCTLHNKVQIGASTDRVLSASDVSGPVAEAMQRLRAAGLTRNIGFSGLGESAAIAQIVDRGAFDAMQCYFNVLNTTAGRLGIKRGNQQDFTGLMSAARDKGMGIFAIRLYAAGALAGTMDRHATAGAIASPITSGATYESDVTESVRLSDLVSELGLESPLELATRVPLSEPDITTAIFGFSDSRQLAEVTRWIERGPLEPSVLEAVKDR